MGSEERIVEILIRVSGKQAAPADRDESLFDSGYLDSFALTDMVSEIEKEFGFSVPDGDLNPRKFDSVARIQAYVQRRVG